jgi:aldehyde:ferredoxin oxidoreductase
MADKLDLSFGNAAAVLEVIERIANRQGVGDLLADGARHAAEIIGGEAHDFAIHVKGEELPLHDPRAKFGLALGYATNEAGPDHAAGFHDALFQNPKSLPFRSMAQLGIVEPAEPLDLGTTKVHNWYVGERWSAFERVAGLCYFGPVPRSFMQVDDVIAAVRAVTGWELSPEDLLTIGDRAINLSRMFNVREGFSRADDVLPERLFTPLESGSRAGVAIPRDDFERALTDLYVLKGWDPITAVPTPQRLRELGIDWTMSLSPS